MKKRREMGGKERKRQSEKEERREKRGRVGGEGKGSGRESLGIWVQTFLRAT
jgi:hypothetical protein